MNIGVIDADLIGRKKHRFPNLASMKISGYHKSKGDITNLLLSYDNIDKFDKVYISKVFLDTLVPEEVLKLKNVEYGGTGFFYDKAVPLPDEIEHHMPDYDLYLKWVDKMIDNGVKKKDLEYYTDYSIGFTTRGCFRKCGFCVNKNYNNVFKHSPVEEFFDSSKKYICLLDDNILGHKEWDLVLDSLKSTNKPFQYKQGMDIRLINKHKAQTLLSCKYRGDYIFAFDNIEDKKIIEDKLKIWRHYNTAKGHNTKLYVFCGFDRNNIWDLSFWKQDIVDLFDRIEILMKYNFLPYVMRYEKYNESPYRGIYINVAQWCNQPSLFANHTYRELCEKDNIRKGGKSATKRYNDIFEKDCPEVAKKYFDLNIRKKFNKNK